MKTTTTKTKTKTKVPKAPVTRAYKLKETPLPDDEQKLCEAYAAARRAEKRAAKVIDALRPSVMRLLGRVPSIHCDGCFIGIGTGVSYEYSDKVTKLEAKLKGLKTEEQASGAALRRETPRPEFKECNVQIARAKVPTEITRESVIAMIAQLAAATEGGAE